MKMSKSTLYIGVDAIITNPIPCFHNDFHITILYSKPEHQKSVTERIYCPNINTVGRINRVEYWENVNLTVAILDDVPELREFRNNLEDAGFKGDLPLILHITLGQGDLINQFDLDRKQVIIKNVYTKVF